MCVWRVCGLSSPMAVNHNHWVLAVTGTNGLQVHGGEIAVMRSDTAAIKCRSVLSLSGYTGHALRSSGRAAGAGFPGKRWSTPGQLSVHCPVYLRRIVTSRTEAFSFKPTCTLWPPWRSSAERYARVSMRQAYLYQNIYLGSMATDPLPD